MKSSIILSISIFVLIAASPISHVMAETITFKNYKEEFLFIIPDDWCEGTSFLKPQKGRSGKKHFIISVSPCQKPDAKKVTHSSKYYYEEVSLFTVGTATGKKSNLNKENSSNLIDKLEKLYRISIQKGLQGIDARFTSLERDKNIIHLIQRSPTLHVNLPKGKRTIEPGDYKKYKAQQRLVLYIESNFKIKNALFSVSQKFNLKNEKQIKSALTQAKNTIQEFIKINKAGNKEVPPLDIKHNIDQKTGAVAAVIEHKDFNIALRYPVKYCLHEDSDLHHGRVKSLFQINKKVRATYNAQSWVSLRMCFPQQYYKNKEIKYGLSWGGYINKNILVFYDGQNIQNAKIYKEHEIGAELEREISLRKNRLNLKIKASKSNLAIWKEFKVKNEFKDLGVMERTNSTIYFSSLDTLTKGSEGQMIAITEAITFVKGMKFKFAFFSYLSTKKQAALALRDAKKVVAKFLKDNLTGTDKKRRSYFKKVSIPRSDKPLILKLNYN